MKVESLPLSRVPAHLRTALLFVGVLVPIHWFVTTRVASYTAADLFVDGAFTAVAFTGPRGARFVQLALPFWFVGLLYEGLPLALHLRGEIHVRELYDAELALFAIHGMTPAAWFEGHLHPILDLLCGAAYLLYLPQTFALGVYLYFRDQARMMVLGIGFLIVNVMGQAIYILYPAAPPWYVEKHGFGPAVLDAAQSPARGVRFDEMTGLGLFHTFYSQSKNVFGAMPSLHCAYPVIGFLAARGLGKRLSIPTGAFAVLIWFSAIYLGHHYVVDVIAGVLCAVAAYAASHWIVTRRR